MIMTVHATPGAVRHALAERGYDVVYVDYDGDTSEVCILGAAGEKAMKELRCKGFKVDGGHRRDGAHSDPTFAQAAQNILIKEHRQRTP